MIELAGIRQILTEAGQPGDACDDTDLALDSLTVVWLVHILKERHGIDLDIDERQVAELTSVRRIYEYVHDAMAASDG